MAGSQEPPGGRLTDHISLGVLSAAFSRDLIEEVIATTGKREKRSRLLPAHVMVRYVIGLPPVTYRAELSGRALKQMHGFPGRHSTGSSRPWRKSSTTRRPAPDLSHQRPLRLIILDITWAG